MKAYSTEIRLNDAFSLDQTFSCGQCFRWEKLAPECWRGAAFGKSVTFRLSGQTLSASCGADEFESIWRPYLDLDRDYVSIREAVSIDGKTAQAARFGAGIRILRQEPWEALCAFILSQCNNIPRIKSIVSRLCEAFGEPIEDGMHAFPTPERLASLSLHDLEFLRCGYRAPYLLAAAQTAASGAIDLDALGSADTKSVLAALQKLPGVGIKVASCTALFGFHRLEVFPVDTWVRKALQADYGSDFDPVRSFGPFAGVAQQYIFYHAREQSGL